MTKDEALKMSLDAMEGADMIDCDMRDAITAIKEVLAQPEQEPVAWVSSEELLVMRGNALGGAKDWRINVGLVKQEGDVGLYTTPPQRRWVGLTSVDWNDFNAVKSNDPQYVAAWAEAKLKEKNT